MVQLKKITACLFFISLNSATSKEILPAAAQAAAAQVAKKVVFALDWTPNTNHLGLYTAVKQGYFKDVGLEVTFVQPTQTSTTQLVAAGRASFGVSFSSDLIKARAAKIPVVSIAAIIQHDTSCFAWRADSGMVGLKDLQGKRYGGWGSPEESVTLNYVMSKAGADPSKVKIVTTGISNFLTSTPKNADFMWVYMGWDGIRAQLANVKLNTYCPGKTEAVFDQHSPIILTSQALINSDPTIVKSFLRAARKGYERAIATPKLAADDMIQMIPELDAALVQASAAFLSKEYARGAKHWGLQDPKRLDAKIKWMQEQKILDSAVRSQEAVSNDFFE